MNVVTVSHEFIDGFRNEAVLNQESITKVTNSFAPPRPWHAEKYSRFLQGLVKQNPRK